MIEAISSISMPGLLRRVEQVEALRACGSDARVRARKSVESISKQTTEKRSVVLLDGGSPAMPESPR
jgi:hypothetical protein